MIQEKEFLFSRKRAFKDAKYIIIIEPDKDKDPGLSNWEGEVNELKSFVVEASDINLENL